MITNITTTLFFHNEVYLFLNLVFDIDANVVFLAKYITYMYTKGSVYFTKQNVIKSVLRSNLSL